MKIAVYTCTRDRIGYTMHCFDSVRRLAGHPFDHYVVDNGSTDGSTGWLNTEQQEGRVFRVRYNPENVGSPMGGNQAFDMILESGIDYDVVACMDNDCEAVTPDFVKVMMHLMSYGQYMLQPAINGIRPQKRADYYELGGWRIGRPAITSGLFQVFPAWVIGDYRYPVDQIPLGGNTCGHISDWFRARGGRLGIVEDLLVNHYETTDGQFKRYPAYFERKWAEKGAYYAPPA